MTRLLLKPIMAAWHTSSEVSLPTIPRPTGVPQAHAPGPSPDRILLLGNGAVHGRGVRLHDLALPGQLARELSQLTGRGVDVDLVAAHDPAAIIRRVPELHVWRYDAVIVICGVDEAIRLESPRRWGRTVRSIIEAIAMESSSTTRTVVSGIQPIRSIPVFHHRLGRLAGAHAKVLDLVAGDVCAGEEKASFVPLPDTVEYTDTDRYRSPDYYRDLARVFAAHLVSLLRAPGATITEPPAGSARALRSQPQDEGERQRAVDALDIVSMPPNVRLGQIIEAARGAFETTSAAITILDRDVQWFLAKAGIEADRMPRSLSVCDVAVDRAGAFVVSDTRLDPRFAHVEHLRFYAGYPIEAPDGSRIGTLCVLDTSPRDAELIDTTMLRHFAMEAQRVLHASLPTFGDVSN